MSCELLLGDCLEKLKELPDESVDLVLTDPPYALVSPNSKSGGGFMGKAWDSEFPKVETWLEIKRVMKAGAFCVFTMSPRQDCLLNCLMTLREAEFEMGFSSLYHIYHTGFPKSMDVSKAIDKRNGLKGKVIGKSGTMPIQTSGRINSEASANGSFERTENIVVEPESEEAQRWSGWKSFSLKPAVECVVVAQKPKLEKTIVGQVLANGCGAVNVQECRIPYGEESDNRIGSDYSMPDKTESNFFKGIRANTKLFKDGRFPANLLCEGEPLKGENKPSSGRPNSQGKIYESKNHVYGKFNDKIFTSCFDSGSPNRFYSLDAWAEKRNITLTEDSAFFDVPKPSKAEKNDGLTNIKRITLYLLCNEKNTIKEEKLVQLLVDMGTFPPKVIDEYGTQNKSVLEWSIDLFGKQKMEKYQKTIGYTTKTETSLITISAILNYLTNLLINEYTQDVNLEKVSGGNHANFVEKCNQSIMITINEKLESVLGVKNAVLGEQLKISVDEGSNRHPTSKPVKLFCYLSKLFCQPKGVVLDPFLGSGTTGVACAKMGFDFIGIEKEAEYFAIAKARIENERKQTRLV